MQQKNKFNLFHRFILKRINYEKLQLKRQKRLRTFLAMTAILKEQLAEFRIAHGAQITNPPLFLILFIFLFIWLF